MPTCPPQCEVSGGLGALMAMDKMELWAGGKLNAGDVPVCVCVRVCVCVCVCEREREREGERVIT
jgi:hypothetical protein